MSKATSKSSESLMIEISEELLSDYHGHRIEHFSLRLKGETREKINRIFQGLLRAKATLSTGHQVDSLARAVQWILERVNSKGQ